MTEETHNNETAIEPLDTHHDDHDHHSDTVKIPLLGEVTVAGGIYTVIFGVLAVLTAIEVIIAESLINNPDMDFFRITSNITIAILKVALVVWFYMHLNRDSRVFLAILLFPTFIVLLSVLFLASLPAGAGLGYS